MGLYSSKLSRKRSTASDHESGVLENLIAVEVDNTVLVIGDDKNDYKVVKCDYILVILGCIMIIFTVITLFLMILPENKKLRCRRWIRARNSTRQSFKAIQFVRLR